MDASKHPVLGKTVIQLQKLETDQPPLSITLEEAWMLFSAVHRLGIKPVLTIMALGAIISHQKREDIPKNLADDAVGILHTIQTLPNPESFEDVAEIFNYMPRYGKNTVDRLVSFTYGLLRRKLLTWREAAEFASVILEENTTPDAWRKRVTRWAEDMDLPKVEQRIRTARASSVRTR